MSADLLRQAAALMRERAEATVYVLSVEGTPVPWHSEGSLALDFDPDDAGHIAGMSPAVALAVADWLEYVARGIEVAQQYGGYVPHADDHALAVARAYLQEPGDV